MSGSRRWLLLVVALVASLFAVASPAEAAAPAVSFFRGDTLAITADPAPAASLNQLRATVVVSHDPGVTVTGMKANPLGATSGNYGAVQGTVRTLSGGGSNYTVVDVAFTPGTGNWPGFTPNGAGRNLQKQACIRLNTSAGELGDQCWTYRTASETESDAVEVPIPYDNHNTTQGTVFTSSPAAFHVAYSCDDNDTGNPGWGQCDQAKLRLRNVGTNATFDLLCGTHTTGSPNCENRNGAPAGSFNADDNTRRDFDFSVANLARGKWVIEALYGNENNQYYNAGEGTLGTYDWSWLGHFYVNPTAPTVGLSGSVAGGGTVARPNTGATVTHTATVSSDAQILDWDVDGNAGNGFELRERATLNFAANAGGTPTFAAGQLAKAVNTTGKAGGSSCGARAKVIDNGVLAATDTPTAAISRASGEATTACTVNRVPTGANAGPIAAVVGGPAVPVNLANADGDNDPRTCEIVAAPTRGTVSAGTSCARTYTPDASPAGNDSFTYRVNDDHGGTSATYTVTVEVADEVVEPADPCAPFETIDACIDQQYADFAGRAPTPTERADWTLALTEGDQTAADLIEALRSAPYWEGTQAPIIRLYSAYFLRTPETGGLNYWINKRRGGMTLIKVSSNFVGSPEFKNRYGSLNNQQFVALVYNNVLDREPDATGLQYWVNKLNGGMPRGQVMLNFSDSSEYRNAQANEVKVVTTYLGMLRRAPSQAEADAAVTRLDGGEPLATIIEEILASAPYAARL